MDALPKGKCGVGHFAHLALNQPPGLHGVGQFLTHIQARFTLLKDSFTAKLFTGRE